MKVTEVPRLRRFWYPVAFAEDLEAGPLARRLLGEDLVVWSDGQGGAAAALDRCPHRSSKLSIGWVEAGCVVCPYHGWQYGPDGKARHIPQLEPGLPIPPKARLRAFAAEVRHGVVWVALDDPLLPIPDLPSATDGYRWIRQFDEVWRAAAPRLMDNSFDPAHVSFVHKASFGNPDRAQIDPPTYEVTARGIVMRNELEVENPDVARGSTGVLTERTVRTTTSEWVAPFLRIMSIRYPNGRTHVLFTSATPVDDEHLRLVQFALRNDTEEDAPAADVVAFDRTVTLEDQALLESTPPDYELEPTALVHLKIDKPTLELRRIYRGIVDGSWPGSGPGQQA